jgi:uncharacterized protein YjbJ (UPF0337 family)
MIHDTNVRPDTLKQQWSSLVPKIRDRYPNLSDQDLLEINGDLDKLVAKISEKHGQSKSEIMNDLTTLITPPEKTVAGNTGSKVGTSQQFQQKEGFKKEDSEKVGFDKEQPTGKKP